jgi:Uncharacterized protein related to capsule biosynthesis enzymes
MCPGCYKPDTEGYCRSCRKLLFDGAKVPATLRFETPQPENLPVYHEKTKKISIPGVQLKYSLVLEGKELKLTEKGGQYILKPIQPALHIKDPEAAPENEHLTMQIASQVYGIRTAANALINFKDGTPAYITRRFDVKKDGTRYLQEDMAQLSGQSRHTSGENFKYESTYEHIGLLIRKHVAASLPALENYFRLLLFNYLFSNGDAHLRNFSIIQTDMGNYTLSPAYDLMSTALHMPGETDTALNLFEGDHHSPFCSNYGFYGKPEFMTLAQKIGILPSRAERMLNRLLAAGDQVVTMISQSFLSDDMKAKYIQAFKDRAGRLRLHV